MNNVAVSVERDRVKPLYLKMRNYKLRNSAPKWLCQQYDEWSIGEWFCDSREGEQPRYKRHE